MIRLRLLTLGVSLVCLLWVGVRGVSANVVGCECQTLKQGLNEVKVNFDSVPDDSPFTTLDKVIAFHPADGVLGDEIVFELDGFRQRYRFEGYDISNKVYRAVRLVEVKSIPDVISLAAIPLPDIFWINHVPTSAVSVTAFGVVAGKYSQMIESRGLPNANGDVFTLRILPPEESSTILKEVSFTEGRIECNEK